MRFVHGMLCAAVDVQTQLRRYGIRTLGGAGIFPTDMSFGRDNGPTFFVDGGCVWDTQGLTGCVAHRLLPDGQS
ncbi:hypothetical protein PsYK624_134990 [Phanerochaete sordida]|uniref:Uncharacterized protein n=1 Tax=Phanerochaete sordida TaxID=48140 RepID=A0A9P3GLR8_9APHY|nr:hypothetical protein PsYK624_134990 [Phanerochaete sordida]